MFPFHIFAMISEAALALEFSDKSLWGEHSREGICFKIWMKGRS